MLRGRALPLIVLVVTLVALTGATATGRSRSCGTLHGGKVLVRRGNVRCATARRVLNYALTHAWGNGPASPRGWECVRISGIRAYNGDECIAPPGAEQHPRKWVQVRFRR